jgi:cAMP-dependent protein kinase regulator
VILKHLEAEQQETIVKAMKAVEKADGEEIIRQADDGDYFYILDSGTVAVYVRKGAQEYPGVKVSEYGPGINASI